MSLKHFLVIPLLQLLPALCAQACIQDSIGIHSLLVACVITYNSCLNFSHFHSVIRQRSGFCSEVKKQLAVLFASWLLFN